MALHTPVARDWIDDVKAGIVFDKWFRPIAHSLANISPRPLPSTAST